MSKTKSSIRWVEGETLREKMVRWVTSSPPMDEDTRARLGVPVNLEEQENLVKGDE